jgi:hypothetical protein
MTPPPSNTLKPSRSGNTGSLNQPKNSGSGEKKQEGSVKLGKDGKLMEEE